MKQKGKRIMSEVLIVAGYALLVVGHILMLLDTAGIIG